MIRRLALRFGAGIILLLLVILRIPTGVSAQTSIQQATPTPQSSTGDIAPTPTVIAVEDEVCISCHGKPGLSLPMADGQNLELFVSPDKYAESIHGEKGYACVQCHPTVGNYPHPQFSAKDRRDLALQLYETCRRCHESQYEKTQDSVHAHALADGPRHPAL